MKEVLLSFDFHASLGQFIDEEYVMSIPFEIRLAELKGTVMLRSSLPKRLIPDDTEPKEAIFFYSVQVFPESLSERSYFTIFDVEDFPLEYFFQNI